METLTLIAQTILHRGTREDWSGPGCSVDRDITFLHLLKCVFRLWVFFLNPAGLISYTEYLFLLTILTSK